MDSSYRPSGNQLPLFLTKKWKKEREDTNAYLASSLEGPANSEWKASHSARRAASDRIFTVEEIENRLHSTATVVSSVQKQIYRGEELCTLRPFLV